MYPVEPKYANVPAYTTLTGMDNENEKARRKSEFPVFAPKTDFEASERSARRHSLGKTNGKSPQKQPRRSGSTDGYGRSSDAVSLPAARHGAVSPLSQRSVSPVGTRSGFVSPMTAGARHGAVSPITTRNGNGALSGTVSPIVRSQSPGGTGAARHSIAAAGPSNLSSSQAMAMKAAQRRQVQSLSLDTQMTNGRPQTGDSEASEEFDEVISLSPAVRAPVKKFRRASSAMSMSAHPDGKNLMLDTVLEGSDKTYFGQDVNPEDLVAVNLENAFDRL